VKNEDLTPLFFCAFSGFFLRLCGQAALMEMPAPDASLSTIY